MNLFFLKVKEIQNIDNYDRFVSQSIDITTDGMTSSPYQIKTGIFAGGCHSAPAGRLMAKIMRAIYG